MTFVPRRQPPIQSAIRDQILPEVHGGAYIGNDHSLPNLNKDRWAQILAYDGTQYYAWQEVFSYDLSGNGSAGFTVADGGLSGQLATSSNPYPINPIFEANGNLIPVGAFVRFRFSHVDALLNDVFVAQDVQPCDGVDPRILSLPHHISAELPHCGARRIRVIRVCCTCIRADM